MTSPLYMCMWAFKEKQMRSAPSNIFLDIDWHRTIFLLACHGVLQHWISASLLRDLRFCGISAPWARSANAKALIFRQFRNAVLIHHFGVTTVGAHIRQHLSDRIGNIFISERNHYLGVTLPRQ